MIQKSLFIIVLFLMGTLTYAQERKGDKYYNAFQYARAIPYYAKAVKKDKKESVLVKLGNCYRKTKNYIKAEEVYGKLVELKPSDPAIRFLYAEALLNNGKYDLAKKEFQTYASLNKSDKLAKQYIYVCDEVKNLNEKTKCFNVYNIKSLNSPVSDFSPVVYKDGIVFVSENLPDLINDRTSNWTGNPYTGLLYAKYEQTKDSLGFKSARSFSPVFNNDALNGSAVFSSDKTEIYFTKADYKKKKTDGEVKRPNIYLAKQNGNSWEIKGALITADSFSVAHPAISSDGTRLYFSSNMKGGYGGTDIYVSKKEGDTWGKPENLGPGVNSEGDEMFPYISNDNRLFFSSNGRAGFGGLDIFVSHFDNGKWSNASNLMMPLNSNRDDFGIFWKDEKSGYISSNREGGVGSDDIYGFTMLFKPSFMEGKILHSISGNDPAANINVLLLTEKGDQIMHTTTDEKGKFRFDNINPDQKYQVKLDETDNSLQKNKYYLTDNKNRVIKVAVKTSTGIVLFTNLPSDLSLLHQLSTEDDSKPLISFSGNLLAGNEKEPLSNISVFLKSEIGDTVQVTKTNSFGSFVFTNIPSDKNYIITLDNNDPSVANKKITLVNKNGKELAVSETGMFAYKFIPSDKATLKLLEVVDDDLRANINGNIFSDANASNPVANVKVNLMDEKENVIQSTKTDDKGKFTFKNIKADIKYLIGLDGDDPQVKGKQLFFISNENKSSIKKFNSVNGKIIYEILPTDQKEFSTIYVDDPWVQVQQLNFKPKEAITIIENIYYELNAYELLPEAKITLDKVVKVMKDNPAITIEISSHTDSRATADYNLKLSKKRAQVTYEYILSKGISKSRLSAVGYGEQKLLNKCKDSVECTEEEHAKNRRTEFKINSK